MFAPGLPLHIVFILDTRCNLSCTHCSSAASTEGSKGYDTEGALRVVDQLAEAGIVDVAFSGGEPLLRNDLESLIAHARKLGLTVGTSTNGYPLTDKRAANLAASGLNRLQVSLDGTPAVHDAIRGAGAFGHAYAAIGRSKRAGLRTHVCFTAMRSNARDLARVIDLAVDAGADGFNLSQFVPTGRGGLEQDLDAATSRHVLEVWLRARSEHPEMYFAVHSTGLIDVDAAAGQRAGGCQAGIGIGCIGADGSVTPCVMFPLVLGNLHERSFREIWTSHPLIARLQRRDVGGSCGTCRHRVSCAGCRAAAWARTGDPLAADPRCWHH